MRECTDLGDYDLVSAPMLFMTRNGIEEKLRAFVERGGVLLTTYWSGVVDAYDLAYLGAVPHGLTDVLGLRATELDALYPETQSNGHAHEGRRRHIRSRSCAVWWSFARAQRWRARVYLLTGTRVSPA